jgi:DNA-directed RNA polymerase subunit RPC12/RpoP
MIIVCPACSDPYQIEDEKIAPLVQIACPHCQDRIILDFEAANDASLVEPGMQTAHGFRTEAEYRQAAGGETAAPAAPKPTPAAPKPTPVAVPKPAAPTPAPTPVPTPPRAQPSTPAATPPRAAKPSPPPTPTPAAKPLELTKKVEPAAEAEPIDLGAPVAQDAGQPQSDIETVQAEGIEEDIAEIDVETPEVVADADAPAHAPPHTPPAAAIASTAPPASEPVVSLDEPRPTPAELSQAHAVVDGDTEDAAEPPKKKGGAGRALLMLFIGLLLIGGALAGWSYVETGDPNPIPFVQSLLE